MGNLSHKTNVLGAAVFRPHYHTVWNVCQLYYLFISNITYKDRDMSFPAATLLLSNAMPREHQGVSASLVATIINYSISLALGLAGTVEVHVNDSSKDL